MSNSQKHGRWTLASDGDGVVCSVCGTDFCTLVYHTDDFKFCPHCGAVMDEKAGKVEGNLEENPDVIAFIQSAIADHKAGRIYQTAIDATEEAVGKTLNGSRTSSLITVIRQLGSGGITEGQAVKILMTSIGVTREEALAIIRGEE